MLKAVRGYYKDGQIELLEKPEGVMEGEVFILFSETGMMQVYDEHREAGRKRFVERLQKGYDLGGPPYPTREEIYADE